MSLHFSYTTKTNITATAQLTTRPNPTLPLEAPPQAVRPRHLLLILDRPMNRRSINPGNTLLYFIPEVNAIRVHKILPTAIILRRNQHLRRCSRSRLRHIPKARYSEQASRRRKIAVSLGCARGSRSLSSWRRGPGCMLWSSFGCLRRSWRS